MWRSTVRNHDRRERAEDVFYITDSDGSILTDEACQRVQDSLVRALDRRDPTRV